MRIFVSSCGDIARCIWGFGEGSQNWSDKCNCFEEQADCNGDHCPLHMEPYNALSRNILEEYDSEDDSFNSITSK
jgi:hypothetical protein